MRFPFRVKVLEIGKNNDSFCFAMLTVVVLVYQLKDPVADLTGRHGDVTGRLEFDLVDDLHHTHITEALS